MFPLRHKNRRIRPVFQTPKRQSDYQGTRATPPTVISMPVLIGAAMIAAAILLAALITTLGTRFAGLESTTEQTVWLIDRLTGNVFKCVAPERGPASCEAEVATGSVGNPPKR
jgi:hypothetical protein